MCIPISTSRKKIKKVVLRVNQHYLKKKCEKFEAAMQIKEINCRDRCNFIADSFMFTAAVANSAFSCRNRSEESEQLDIYLT